MKTLSDKQQAELGVVVAELKTLLHDTENKITNCQLDCVDWPVLAFKLESLVKRIKSFIEEEDEEEENTPAPAPPPPPTPKKADARRK